MIKSKLVFTSVIIAISTLFSGCSNGVEDQNATATKDAVDLLKSEIIRVDQTPAPVTLELFSRNDIWTEADKNVSHFDFLSSDDSVYIKCAVKFIEDGFDGQVDYTDLNDEVLSDFEKLRPLLKSSFNYCKNSWKPTLYNEASLRYFSLEYLIRKSFRSAPAKEAILFADLKKRMMVFISENLDESEISKQIEGANFSSIEHLLSEGGASRVSQAFISDYYLSRSWENKNADLFLKLIEINAMRKAFCSHIHQPFGEVSQPCFSRILQLKKHQWKNGHKELAKYDKEILYFYLRDRLLVFGDKYEGMLRRTIHYHYMEKCQNEGLIRNHQKIQNLVFNEIGENYDPETHLWDFMKKSEAGDFNLSEPELIDYYSEQEYEYYIPDVNIETFFEYSRSVRFELPSDYNKTYEIVRKRIDEEFWKNFGNKIISSYSKELEQKTERDFKLTNVRKSISDILEDEEKKSCRKSVFAISESEKVADFIRYVRKDGKLEYFKPLIKYYKNIDRSGEFEKLVIMEANDMLPLFDTDPIKYIQGIEK